MISRAFTLSVRQQPGPPLSHFAHFHASMRLLRALILLFSLVSMPHLVKHILRTRPERTTRLVALRAHFPCQARRSVADSFIHQKDNIQ